MEEMKRKNSINKSFARHGEQYIKQGRKIVECQKMSLRGVEGCTESYDMP